MSLSTITPGADVELPADVTVAHGGAYIYVDGLAVAMLPADENDEAEVRKNLVNVERTLMTLAVSIPDALGTVRDLIADIDGLCKFCSGNGDLALVTDTVTAVPCDYCHGTGKAQRA